MGQSRLSAERRLRDLENEMHAVNRALQDTQRLLLHGEDPPPGATTLQRAKWILRDLQPQHDITMSSTFTTNERRITCTCGWTLTMDYTGSIHPEHLAALLATHHPQATPC